MSVAGRRTVVALAAALVLAACSVVGPPDQRGEPYEFRLAPDDPVFRWPETSLPVRVYAQPAGPLPQYVTRALRIWEAQFLYGEFRAELVSDSTTADVVVLLEGDPPPDAPLTADPPVETCSGVTSVPAVAESGEQLVYSAPFGVGLRWFGSPNPSDIANCLARVTIHEIGHVLGIFAHSGDPADLMSVPVTVSQPSANDQSTVRDLYHFSTDILPWAPNRPLPELAAPAARVVAGRLIP